MRIFSRYSELHKAPTYGSDVYVVSAPMFVVFQPFDLKSLGFSTRREPRTLWQTWG